MWRDTSLASRPPEDLLTFVESAAFPCAGAKSALALGRLHYIEAGRLCDSADDALIHDAIADFGASPVRDSAGLRSLAILFRREAPMDEATFEKALWRRLQALHDIDAARGVPWARNVSSDPRSPQFGMSVGGAAYFVIGLHPGASRAARRFARPALVFNSHDQFERLRQDGRYQALQSVTRRRDRLENGSINPMLAEFGVASEAPQYSGRTVGPDWRCPLKVHA